ncbi:MAG: hypothetical protein JXP34_06220 [Planctomycetes bacterium]|nr:hypothetical protein [Planctomycetota bacterium]
MPHLNEIERTFGPRGLVVIGVTYESREEVEPFVAKAGIRYRIARDPDEWLSRLLKRPSEPIPRAFLVRYGTILWEGHPDELPASRIEETLVGSAPEPGWKLPAGLDRIRILLQRKRFGLAAQALAGFRDRGGAEAEAAGRTLESLRAYASAVARDLGTCAAKGDPLLALRSLRSFEAAFGDWEGASALRELSEAWARNPALDTRRRIRRVIEGAGDLVRKGDVEAARALLLEAAAADPGEPGAAMAHRFAERLADWR